MTRRQGEQNPHYSHYNGLTLLQCMSELAARLSRDDVFVSDVGGLAAAQAGDERGS